MVDDPGGNRSLIWWGPPGSERRIDGLALQREDAEDALVHAVERLLRDESFEGLDAEGELSERERPLVAQPARAEAGEVGLGGVLRAVDDPEVLPAAALDAGLRQSLRPAV